MFLDICVLPLLSFCKFVVFSVTIHALFALTSHRFSNFFFFWVNSRRVSEGKTSVNSRVIVLDYTIRLG